MVNSYLTSTSGHLPSGNTQAWQSNVLTTAAAISGGSESDGAALSQPHLVWGASTWRHLLKIHHLMHTRERTDFSRKSNYYDRGRDLEYFCSTEKALKLKTLVTSLHLHLTFTRFRQGRPMEVEYFWAFQQLLVSVLEFCRYVYVQQASMGKLFTIFFPFPV